MSFDTCPQCNYSEATATQTSQRKVTHVMNTYQDTTGVQAIFNDNRAQFSDGKGVVWTLVKSSVVDKISPQTLSDLAKSKGSKQVIENPELVTNHPPLVAEEDSHIDIQSEPKPPALPGVAQNVLAGLTTPQVEPAGNDATGIAKGATVVKAGTPIGKHGGMKL